MDANLIIATLIAGLPADVIRELLEEAQMLARESQLLSCLLKILLLVTSLSRKKKGQPQTDWIITFQVT
jgi:hypothetical protein